jgi:hypothetical protein
MFGALIVREAARNLFDRSSWSSGYRPVRVVAVAMTLLEQVQSPSGSEHQGVVGDRSQPPALCFLERARALGSIEREKAAMVLQPLARLGPSEPGPELCYG